MWVDVSRKAPNSPLLANAKVRRWAVRMLQHLALTESELSVLLTNDSMMAGLNQTYRSHAGPTDVLSFESIGWELRSEHAQRYLGDIAISLDTAARQARRAKHDLEHEVCQLLAHGLLHLLGLDHPTPQALEQMQRLTRRLVACALGRGDISERLQLPSALGTKAAPRNKQKRARTAIVPLPTTHKNRKRR